VQSDPFRSRSMLFGAATRTVVLQRPKGPRSVEELREEAVTGESHGPGSEGDHPKCMEESNYARVTTREVCHRSSCGAAKAAVWVQDALQ